MNYMELKEAVALRQKLFEVGECIERNSGQENQWSDTTQMVADIAELLTELGVMRRCQNHGYYGPELGCKGCEGWCGYCETTLDNCYRCDTCESHDCECCGDCQCYPCECCSNCGNYECTCCSDCGEAECVCLKLALDP